MRGAPSMGPPSQRPPKHSGQGDTHPRRRPHPGLLLPLPVLTPSQAPTCKPYRNKTIVFFQKKMEPCTQPNTQSTSFPIFKQRKTLLDSHRDFQLCQNTSSPKMSRVSSFHLPLLSRPALKTEPCFCLQVLPESSVTNLF